MKDEGRIRELLFSPFEDAFDEEVGDIIIGEAFYYIFHVFDYARESGCIIEGEEYCDIGNSGFNVHAFGASISYFEFLSACRIPHLLT